jgi:hypothetical protein
LALLGAFSYGGVNPWVRPKAFWDGWWSIDPEDVEIWLFDHEPNANRRAAFDTVERILGRRSDV